MAQLDRELVKLAFQAVRFPERWQQLLQHIIDITPAKAAIITLRDKATCQIVNDDVLEREFHSPLIQGFPLEAVVYYIEELRTIDPWAKAQIHHHPHRPTIMSTICHPDDADDRRFFDWLAQGGLRDTIAFELDRVPGHWTAINLFLADHDPQQSAVLKNFCDVHFDLLSEAWRASQHVIKCQQSGQAALNYLSSKSVPACIVAPSGEVFLANEAFQSLSGRGIAKTSTPSGRLSLCGDAQISDAVAASSIRLLRHDAVEFEVHVSASPFEPDPLYENKKERYWLLRFHETVDKKLDQVNLAYPLDLLTPQERELFDAVSLGASVQDAGKMIGIRRSRAFDVWSEIKIKLGIVNAHELRGMVAALA